MNIVDFSNCPISQRVYGGAAGRKLGIIYNNEKYMLKFPGNLKEQNLKNIELSYSNSPVSEYIGSQIYASIGLPVHDTILGKYNEKIVVACKDFIERGCRLQEFEKYKVTFNPNFLDSNGNQTNGTGTDLQEILLTIKEHNLFQDHDSVMKRFWNMFVVDALIGNPDRNNGNWGFIIDENKNDNIRLAPVYDNGNCLNNKWDDIKINNVLSNQQNFVNEAYSGRRCILMLNGRNINPYKLLQSGQYEDANAAIKRIVPCIDMYKINNIIYDVPNELASPLRKEFFSRIIEMRYRDVLIPIYRNITKTISFEEKLEKISENEFNGFFTPNEPTISKERS